MSHRRHGHHRHGIKALRPRSRPPPRRVDLGGDSDSKSVAGKSESNDD